MEQSFEYTTNGTTLTSLTGKSASTGTAYLGIDSSTDPDYLRIISPDVAADVVFDKNAGDIFNLYSGTILATGDGSTKAAWMVSPSNMDYQTFGFWLEVTGDTAGKGGGYSTGYATPAISIPTSGTAVYSGSAVGLYSSPAGEGYITVAGVTATTNFGTRNIAFSTGNTLAFRTSTGAQTSQPSLNMSGTLSYTSGSNSFTGAVTTTSGMTGSATGRFYGGLAEEMGGTYAMNVSGLQGMQGAFGAKR